MTKPLGFYTNYVPGQEGILDKIQEMYGPYLMGITAREKLYLIQELTRDLFVRASGNEVRREMHLIAYDLTHELSTSDQEGMIQALIAHLRDM